MGKLFVVGLGPGGGNGMTLEARHALDRCDVICGYTKYVELIRADYPDKRYIATGMKSEIERCRAAIEAARDSVVAVVCSGDAGIYGMAGLIYELAAEEENINPVIIPGVTAAVSGAAALGAPLMQDFAVISLSDLLVPWEVIERRLHGVGAGDFAAVLYNPMSTARQDNLQKACDILLQYREPGTVCGTVFNIGRDGETARVMTLIELRSAEVNMFTTVFIGNSTTKNIGGKMVTPRGYERKQEYNR